MLNKQNIDTISQELIISPHRGGVKLTRPNKDDITSPKQSVAAIFSLPIHVFFLNTDSMFQKCNVATADTLNFLSVREAIGKSVQDVLEKEGALSVIHNDKTTLKIRKLNIIDEHAKRVDNIDLQGISFKFPWYDSANEITGLFGFSIILSEFGSALAQALSLITQTGLLSMSETPISKFQSSLLGQEINNVYLSSRELDITRLLVRGKTAKEIAIILERSKRTVEHHIENIKVKMATKSKSELIEKIIDYFN